MESAGVPKIRFHDFALSKLLGHSKAEMTAGQFYEGSCPDSAI